MILSLSCDALARLLTESGWKPVTSEMIRQCLSDGAPSNPDGTIETITFLVWLLKESGRLDG